MKLSFGIFCCLLRYCIGVPTDTEKEGDFYLKIARVTSFKDILCPNNSRLLSFNDVQRLKDNITWEGKVWINASGRYTPWMEYKDDSVLGYDDKEGSGIKTKENNKIKTTTTTKSSGTSGVLTIHKENIESTTRISKNKNPFTTCINFCERQQDIGLQTDTCFCLRENTTTKGGWNELQHETYCDFKPNNGNRMTVYSKADVSNLESGECLTAYINTRTQTYSTESRNCSEISGVRCFMENSFRSTPVKTSYKKAEKYCSLYTNFTSLPTNRHLQHEGFLKDLRIKQPNMFWLADIRKPYFSQGESNVDTIAPFPSYCVTGQIVNGKVTLHMANCTEQHPFICTNQKNIMIESASSGISPNFIVTTNEVGSRAAASNEDSNLMIIILGPVGGLVIVLSVVVIVFVKRHKQRSNTIRPEQTVKYATVQDTRGTHAIPRPESCTNQSSSKTESNDIKIVKLNTPMEDGIYDHTNFTLRQAVQQQEASNYDTMESMQILGESIYSRSETVRTTREKMEFAEDDYFYS